MDLKNLTPKDKMLYETATESKKVLLNDLKNTLAPEEYENFEEVIHFISRAEYKRGKADGSALN